MEQLLAEARQHHAGLAAGQVAGGLLLRGVHRGSKQGELFGFHDKMPAAVLKAIYGDGAPSVAGDEGWILAREQRRYIDDLRRLQDVPLPPVDQWIDGGVDLLHHEARGGHTLWKHVGRDEAFLRRRQAAQPGRFGAADFSSFTTLVEAKAAVRSVLLANRISITEHFGSSSKSLLVTSLWRSENVIVDKFGNLMSSQGAVVVLVRESGEVRVQTTYLTTRSLQLAGPE